MKILVIDDDQLVRYTISKILENAGHQVVVAEDGMRGFALFEREHPDVVITDLIMPEQEGIETIIRIKRQRPEVRVIAISGGGRLGNLDALGMAQRLGADDVIAKPFAAAELVRRISPPGAAVGQTAATRSSDQSSPEANTERSSIARN
jgi:CheY-like chemotaxis protein